MSAPSSRAAGYQALGGGTLTVVNRSYDDWLPSANVALDVTSNFVVRLAAARVMARPQLGNLSPGGSINTTGQLSITTGNPLLDPFRANTLDASFEWYFAPESRALGRPVLQGYRHLHPDAAGPRSRSTRPACR